MDVVQSYMLGHNFTDHSTNCSGRPPAIGEEHEVTSVDGRQSTHSSVSGKSERSTATPRRPDMDLGYEPEGSDSPFPPYERWKVSLHNLMQDSDGLKEFRSFLAESEQDGILDCWFAMKGFRKFGLKSNGHQSGNSSAASSTCGSLSSRNTVAATMDYETLQKRTKLAKVICRKFVRKLAASSMVSIIKEPTKMYITQQIKSAEKSGQALESDLFVQAQTEIELNMEANHYKKFLESERFHQYTIQCDNASVKSTPSTTESKEVNMKPADQSSDSPGSKYLPSINEHHVWQPAKPPSDLRISAIHQRMQNNRNATEGDNKILVNFAEKPSNAAYPYYTNSNYWVPPASAIGSDQASKSSDATSETFTDTSSMDNQTSFSHSGSVTKRAIKTQAKKNKCTGLQDTNHVPRTSRCASMPMLATNNPKEFFAQLKVKLDKVIEERRKQKIEAAKVRAAAVMKENEEDLDQMMEIHLARAFQNTGGRNSPPIPPGYCRVPHGHAPVAAQGIHLAHGSAPSDARYKQPGNNPGYPALPKTGSLLRRVPDDKLGVGIVPAMPQNEVPDVETPVNPVDKNQMISAWIGQMPPPARGKRSLKLRRSVEPSVATVPEEEPSIVNPASSTGLSRSDSLHPRMQPLAQDLSMPILMQPDSNTTIEEVKRRLIEETDGSFVSDFASLKLDARNEAPAASLPQNPAPVHISTSFSSGTVEQRSHSDTDSSSTETATFANTTQSANNQQVVASQPLRNSNQPSSTTVVFYVPNEECPYKMHLPFYPITLSQFKSALPRRLNCRYFFKEHSRDLGKATYCEYNKDDDVLPFYDGFVIARLRQQAL